MIPSWSSDIETSLKEEKVKKFVGQKDYSTIQKYELNEEGNRVTNLNQRTMARKALAAFLKGNDTYRYKGSIYVVPTIVDIEQLKKQANGE